MFVPAKPLRVTDISCQRSIQQRLYPNNFLLIVHNENAQMTTSNPRAGWEKVGDQFYRKIQLYESVFDPDLELENYLVAGAPLGGAIGISCPFLLRVC
jgi:Vps16, N-terminal region